ncbi:oligosaccharide flippase family protein, partial [Escherichia coli]|nr:oligosaccharide flippase family protein [Escherichia coli]
MIKTRDGLWQVLVVLFSLIATLVQLKLSTLFLDSYFLGILALASIPLLLANVISDFGIANYLIHKTNIEIEELSAVYGLAFCMGVMASFCLIIVGGCLSYFYHDNSILYVTLACIPVVVLSCLISVSYAVANSGMYFKVISLSDIYSKLVLTLFLFLFFNLNLGIYSIAAAQFMSCLVKFFYLMSWSYKNFLFPRRKFIFKLSLAVDAIPFGISQLGSQLLNIVGQKVDELILGKCLGVAELGIYSIIKQLLVAANGFISAPVRRLLMPVFSRGVSKEQFLSIYFKYLIGLTVFYGVFIVKPQVTSFIFNNLKGYEIELSIFALAWLYRVSSGNLQSAYMVSRGRPGVEFRWNMIQTIFLSIMLFLSSFYITALKQYSIILLFCNFLLVIYSSLYFNITKHFAFK